MKIADKTIRKSLLSLSFLFALFVASVVIGNSFFHRQVLNEQASLLENKLTVFLRYFPFETVKNRGYLSEDELTLVRSYTSMDNDKIALFTSDGRLFFDSSEKETIGTTSNTPELHAVLRGAVFGKNVRANPTSPDSKVMYLALPVRENGQVIGFARISENITGFSRTINSFRTYLIVTLALLFILLMIFILRLIRVKNEPIETILPFLQKMIEEPDKRRSILSEHEELNELYETVNTLNAKIRHTHRASHSIEKQFYQFINSLLVGVFIIDKDNTIQQTNTALEEILNKKHLAGKNYLEVFNANDLLKPVQYALMHKQDLQKEIRLEDARQSVLDLSLRYIHDKNSSIQMIGSAYDLTHVRMLEKMQKDFVGNVSHELKTPVTSFIGFTETLLNGAMEDPEITRTFLEIMQKDANRLEHLIQEILQLSRDVHPYDNPKQPVYLRQFAEGLIESYQRQIKEKQLNVQLIVASQQIFPTTLEIFQPIVKNLLENAIQYTGEKGDVWVKFDKIGNTLQLSIQDSGMGINPAHQARIFDRFYRIDKARARNSGGTGLGLSIVQNNVRLLGGTIELHSQVGNGSTFTVNLPFDNNNKNEG